MLHRLCHAPLNGAEILQEVQEPLHLAIEWKMVPRIRARINLLLAFFVKLGRTIARCLITTQMYNFITSPKSKNQKI